MRQWISSLLADLREALVVLKEIHEELRAIAELLRQIDPDHNLPHARFLVSGAELK